MNMPAIFEEKINQELELFCKQLTSSPEELYNPIQYTLSLGGKRARPLMVMLGCNLFSDDVEQSISPAIAIELFHNFTLIHDDLMDNAPLRRGKATVHEKWNKNISIISGDAMLVKAYQVLAKTEVLQFSEILNVFNETALQVCEGQQLDMNYEKKHKISISQYIKMIELKTAVLVAASFKIGALTANAKKEDANTLYQFGKNLGIAFQLQDDLLDVYGDEKKFGKQKGGDIVSNKKTFLLIKAMEMANGYQAEELNNWIMAPQLNLEQKVEAVTNIYNFLGIKELTEKTINFYFNEALKQLSMINSHSSKKEHLLGFVNTIMAREK